MQLIGLQLSQNIVSCSARMSWNCGAKIKSKEMCYSTRAGPVVLHAATEATAGASEMATSQREAGTLKALVGAAATADCLQQRNPLLRQNLG